MAQFGNNTLLGGSDKGVSGTRAGRAQERSASSAASIRGRRLSPGTEAGFGDRSSGVHLMVPMQHRAAFGDRTSPTLSKSDYSGERRPEVQAITQSFQTQSTLYQ